MSLLVNWLWNVYTMQYSIRLPFQVIQHLGEIRPMNMSSIKRQATLVPVAFSISSLIYFLTIYAKVPIRVTLSTTPSLEIVVEINPDKSLSCFNFQQDIAGILIASHGDGKITSDSSHLQYDRE